MIKYLTLIFAVFLLFSCDKEKDYDKKKAVSAFAIIDPIRIDESLKNVEVKLPKEQENFSWINSNEVQNRNIENIAFDFPKKNKIKKQKSIWSGFNFRFDNRFVFSPVIVDNKAFLLDGSGILEGYNLKNNKRIFKTRVFARNFIKNYQIPKISYFEGKIFAIAGINQIAAVDSKTGDILWKKTIAAIPVSTPIPDSEKIYVTTNDNKLYALSSLDGELQWVQSGISRPAAIFGAADPVIYKNLVLASYSSGEIYAYNKETGEIAWIEDLNLNKATNSDFYLNDIDATPIVKDGIAYSIGNGGLIKAINAKEGSYLWRREIAGIIDFWVAKDFLFVINNDDKLIALHRKTGKIKWVSQLLDYKNKKKPQSKIIYSGVVMAGNKLLVTDVLGEILIISPFDGKIEKTIKTGSKIFHSPIIVNKEIYIHAMGRYIIELIKLK